MTTDNKTLTDAQPGGRVRLGAGLRSELLEQAERLERMAAQDRETGESIEQALEAGEEYTPDDAPDVAAGLQHDANRSEEIAALLRKAAAALSAQPSPGGQDAPQCWWIDHGTYGQITQRQDEADSAVNAGKRVVTYAARQPVGEPVACVRDLLPQEVLSAISACAVIAKKESAHPVQKYVDTINAWLYAAPPAQQPAQVYLDGLDRALGETIDQRDRYHEMADDLAGHIAAITGVDIGEHSSGNCPWQNAIEAAEEYKPTQAVDLGAVRAALDAAEGLAVVCASVDGYSREEVAASGRAMRQQFADARALIDSQAVGNG